MGEIKSLKKMYRDAFNLANELSKRRYTFFLGAGFSKNLKRMPNFYELVLHQTLPAYYKDLVTTIDNFQIVKRILDEDKGGFKRVISEEQEEALRKVSERARKKLEDILEIAEFQPKNCIHCFIYSYLGSFKKDNWTSEILQAKVVDPISGQPQNLQSYISQFKKIHPEQVIEFARHGVNLDQILDNCSSWMLYQLKDVSNLVRVRNFEQCKALQCLKKVWVANDDYFYLGLLKSYLEIHSFQFKDLIEYIQKNQEKIAVAQYVFDGKETPFELFSSLLKRYYRSSVPVIGDSQLVIARLAREGLINEVITTNWDNLIELACHGVGMYVQTSDGQVYGKNGEILKEYCSSFEYKRYYNHAIAISERADYYNSSNMMASSRNGFYIYKIHGSVDTIIKNLQEARTTENFCANMVITHRDLLDWREDHWAEDLVKSILRSHDVVFAGISGQDNVIYATVRKLIEEMKEAFSVYNRKGGKSFQKNVYSVNIKRNLILDNMLSETDFISSNLYQIDPILNWNHYQGTDLFYRWLYVHLILTKFQSNLENYIRKAIIFLNEDTLDYALVREFQRTLENFLERLTRPDELAFDFMNVVFDIIPRSLNYTWLFNRNYRVIGAQRGGIQHLLEEKDYYLPIFYYIEWFTVLLVIYSLMFEIIETKRRRSSVSQYRPIKCTKDGVFIYEGIAIITVIYEGQKNYNWKNLLKFGIQKFSTETHSTLNKCRKRYLIVLNSSLQDPKEIGGIDTTSIEKYKLFEIFPIDLRNNDVKSKLEDILNGVWKI